jgi:tetratricopeptide (TPR) repeat protein
MPFTKKTDQKSQPFIPLDTKRIFVGRASEIDFFINNILRPEDPLHNIISIAGEGGVGKSTLLERLEKELNSPEFKDYCLVAHADERHSDPAAAMEVLADQFHHKDHKLETFEEHLTKYKEALRKLQTERDNARSGLAQDFMDNIVAPTVGSAIPLAGGVLKEGVKSATKYVLNERRERQLARETERVEDSLKDLTNAFLTDLNKLADSASVAKNRRTWRILLFFDTFERTASELAPWLLDYVLEAEIRNGIVLVVAGRDPLAQTNPSDPKRWLPYVESQSLYYSIPLAHFNLDDTRAYLAQRGIVEVARVEAIWQKSGGLPLYLGLLASNPHGELDATESVVANYLRWIQKDDELGDKKRRLALETALFSKPFNQDDFAAFGSYIKLEGKERVELFQWLVKESFVRKLAGDGRYQYQDAAQTVFSEQLYQTSRVGYYACRKTIADYYRASLNQLELAKGKKAATESQEWLETCLALVYQLLLMNDLASYLEATELVLKAYHEVTEVDKAEIVNVLKKLTEAQTINHLATLAQTIIAQLLVRMEREVKSQEFLRSVNILLEKADPEVSKYKTLSAELQRLKGRHYYEVAEYRQAIVAYSLAIELDPSYIYVYNRRGFAYYALKKYKEALEDYNRVIEVDPKNVYVYNNRGLAYSKIQEYGKALEDYNQALKLDLKFGYAYRNRGNVYFAMKKYDKALEDYNRTIELDPKFVFVYNSRGNAYSMMQKYDKALEDYNQAIELDPKYVDAYHSRGNVYFAMKEYGKAIEDYNRVIELGPNNTYAYYNRGLAYYMLREYSKARENYKRVIELDPSNTYTYYNNGKARENYKRVIELDPSNTYTHYDNGSDAYSRGGYGLEDDYDPEPP